MDHRTRCTRAMRWMVPLGLVLLFAGAPVYANHLTVRASDIVKNAIRARHVQDDAIRARHVQGDTIRARHIRDGAVTASKLAEGAVGAPDWREIGEPGQPAFSPMQSDCLWENFGSSGMDTAGFTRDRSGFVHLKGLVRVTEPIVAQCSSTFESTLANRAIFTLPVGYRPAANNTFVIVTNDELGRVTMNVGGWIFVDAPPVTFANASQWLTLSGISFRCAPSGVNGCP